MHVILGVKTKSKSMECGKPFLPFFLFFFRFRDGDVCDTFVCQRNTQNLLAGLFFCLPLLPLPFLVEIVCDCRLWRCGSMFSCARSSCIIGFAFSRFPYAKTVLPPTTTTTAVHAVVPLRIA